MSASDPTGDADPTGTVLCVEDNTLCRLLVEDFLARWPGVRLVCVATAAQALDHARSLNPDLLLLDLNLPDRSGLELLRELRGEAATRALRVVVLSADAGPGDIERARAAGADDYWTKPLDLAHFERGLREHLAGT